MPITIVTKKPAKAAVSVQTLSKGQVVTEEQAEEDVAQPLALTPLGHPGAEVGIETSATINTGNYNSVRVGASLKLLVDHDSIDEAAVFIEDWLNKRMEALTSEIVPAAD
jgi:hypothetical protein